MVSPAGSPAGSWSYRSFTIITLKNVMNLIECGFDNRIIDTYLPYLPTVPVHKAKPWSEPQALRLRSRLGSKSVEPAHAYFLKQTPLLAKDRMIHKSFRIRHLLIVPSRRHGWQVRGVYWKLPGFVFEAMLLLWQSLVGLATNSFRLTTIYTDATFLT